jgi:hypothetical protein
MWETIIALLAVRVIMAIVKLRRKSSPFPLVSHPCLDRRGTVHPKHYVPSTYEITK